MNKTEASATLEDWLAVSTDGFAAMNAGRAPAHLVKELVQNALDALGEAGGRIDLTARLEPGGMRIECRDDGCGIANLVDIRTVFHTSKTDSHLKRGRMGRGFKEMLCLASSATVTSGNQCVRFLTEDGRRITRLCSAGTGDTAAGTLVAMLMPWNAGVIAELDAYFHRLLLPKGAQLLVNQLPVAHRPCSHFVQARLPTELLQEARWVRPVRMADIELVPVAGTADVQHVYELGIPVCPAEWDVPYHINVLQRVPMNPCRDAVASGYLVKLHRECLPVLLAEMNSEQVRADWVGSAAPGCGDHTQKQVIKLGFGEDIVRSVPAMGVRQFDEDAHHLNAHHGRDFHKELENLAGRAARLMLMQARHIWQQHAGLLPQEQVRES